MTLTFERALSQIPEQAHHPDLAVSILEGFKFRYTTTSHREGTEEYKFYPVHGRDKDGNVLRSQENGAEVVCLVKADLGKAETEYIGEVEGYLHNRQCKPVVHPKHRSVYDMADDERLLMTTLGSIAKLLSIRTSTESVIDKYFEPYFAEGIRI